MKTKIENFICKKEFGMVYVSAISAIIGLSIFKVGFAYGGFSKTCGLSDFISDCIKQVAEVADSTENK